MLLAPGKVQAGLSGEGLLDRITIWEGNAYMQKWPNGATLIKNLFTKNEPVL
jgi:hypothetical protein